MVKKNLAQLLVNDSKEEQQECCADSKEWGVVVGGMVPPIQALQS